VKLPFTYSTLSFFLINQIYKNFTIEVLPLQSAVGWDEQTGSLRFLVGRLPCERKKRNVPDCAGMGAVAKLL
jgi:hypothetical protein